MRLLLGVFSSVMDKFVDNRGEGPSWGDLVQRSTARYFLLAPRHLLPLSGFRGPSTARLNGSIHVHTVLDVQIVEMRGVGRTTMKPIVRAIAVSERIECGGSVDQLWFAYNIYMRLRQISRLSTHRQAGA